MFRVIFVIESSCTRRYRKNFCFYFSFISHEHCATRNNDLGNNPNNNDNNVTRNFELYSEMRNVRLNRFPMSPVSTKYLRISVKDLTGLHGISRTPWGFFWLRNKNGRMDRWMDPSIKVLVKI